MSIPTRVRLAACLVLALAAGGVAVARVLPLGPWLEIQVIHRFEERQIQDPALTRFGRRALTEALFTTQALQK